MEHATKMRAVLATAAATVALAVPVAVARAEAETASAPATGTTLEAPSAETTPAEPTAPVAPETEEAPAAPVEKAPSVKQETTLVPPPVPATKTAPPSGGVTAGSQGGSTQPPTETPEAAPEAGATPAPVPGIFAIPSLPNSSCAISGVPPVLIPIYQKASDEYGLGAQGPAILAGINAIETAFGTNLGPSSAGAVGWMQFMPETWAMYGVDANGDGVKDPNNPEDAIFAAARYLSAAGMPADTWGAIFAYNHADWYVEEVLTNAGCYAGEVGGDYTTLTLAPQIQTFECTPAKDWRRQIPKQYLAAFEAAAGRYELGKRGVWTLAAIARLESNFGRGMTKRQLRTEGPLGLDKMEWSRYAVDGDKDGRLRRADVEDSAATLARMMWSRGSIDAGVFTHNQASWYVDAVDHEANLLSGKCTTGTESWAILIPGAVASQINWSNLTLSNDLELRDIQAGLLDQRITGLLALMTQEHQITITALRSDHSQMTASGNVSNHFYGRAMDIASVDGVSCTDTSPTAPCAELGYQLAQLQDPLHPTELIYCFDLDGPGPAFSLPDHCDHIHAGFYAY
ncbi:MAG TPA: lytic murein transglycosylase [Solirubrobacterales bacterium]|nr:lytic murein transglycosylase [Solirubrobacterales bacterium]